jgi:hypothetical protein
VLGQGAMGIAHLGWLRRSFAAGGAREAIGAETRVMCERARSPVPNSFD